MIRIFMIICFIILFSTTSNIVINKYTIIIAVMSCNRYEYINNSLASIINHIQLYEKEIISTIIHFDQGTPERGYIKEKFNIKNIFFTNPKGYTFSFQLLFSYLYMKFVLILEEDWVIVNNIEKKIKYHNFLYISTRLLSNSHLIYGLYLRHHPLGISTKRVYSKLNITYYEIYKPWGGCCYTNGASIYKAKYLKIMNYGITEYHTAKECMKRDYHIGYILWEYCHSNNGIFYTFKHIGKKSTKQGICNISLY